MASGRTKQTQIEPTDESKAAGPRRPLQERSRLRVEKLLDATDKLLAAHEPGEVGLYDIARVAKVPPASVYHFFPTKEAAFVALAERYLQRLYKVVRETPLDRKRIRHWSDVFILGSQRSFDFYNRNPVLLKLFFGGALSPEIRRRDDEYLRGLSEGGYDWLNRYFCMPYLPDPEMKFSVIWSIYDGITLTSYQRHGCVTEAYHDEMLRAIIAYCRTFLPDVLPLRPPGDVAD
jgi:AcrR family transcriptional regulator